MRSFIKLILMSYNTEHRLSPTPLCFKFFISALSRPRKFATVGLKMAIGRSNVIFQSCKFINLMYLFAKSFKKPVLENISQNRIETSPSAQWLMWYMTTAPARI